MRISTDTPRFSDVIKTLEAHDLLPAIVFISSRKGCDEAAETFRNRIPDLSSETRRQIEETIEGLDPSDAQFVRSHRHFYLLSFKGIAAHHAGHLPAWKHAVESLMSRGLLRAVFATTTLAAGIDMPARSVVITASSLRDDEGHRDLKAFELAQMTGRAGRRGKDKVGFAIFIPGPFQDIQLVYELLHRSPEPIQSSFTPNYTMVLNLLQQHSIADARDLLERSLGQYQRLKRLARLRPEHERLSKELEDNLERPCNDRVSTWNRYRDTESEVVRLRKELNFAHKLELKTRKRGIDLEEYSEEELIEIRTRLQALEEKLQSLPCSRCSQFLGCGKRVAALKHSQREIGRIETQLRSLEHGLWERFEGCACILEQFEYLDSSWRPTTDGVWASRLRVENVLFVAELLKAGYFSTEDPKLLAALVGALAASEREIEVDYLESEKEIVTYYKSAVKIARKIAQVQERAGLFFPIIIDGDAARLLLMWADPGVRWRDLLRKVKADEGDIVRLILRTSDILGQLTHLSKTHPRLSSTAREAIQMIRRAPIED